MSLLGEDRLGMELYALDRKRPVPHAHDGAILAERRRLEAFREARGLDHEGVVARGDEGIGHPLEAPSAVVADHRGLAVHELCCRHDLAAEDLRDALVAETDAEHRHAGRAEMADRRHGDSGALRPARSGRDHEGGGPKPIELGKPDRVVAKDKDARAELP